ncbi:MAG: VWA domain-containing protein [Hydrogenimonas sp.]|nr:VWA domain-containing protein [Hydrogenimonas sp.]
MKFLYPEFIYLMLIPAVLLFYLISTNRDRLERLFLPEVLDRLRIEGDSLGRGGHNILAFAAFLFMTLALAQPVVEKGEMVVKSEGADLVIALDLSRSMNATDFYPDRVAFAKQKLQELIPELPVGRIGIVGFTSASFIVAPLTEDRDTLLFLLKRLKPEYISRDGTDIVAALKGALKLLEKSSSKKVLLVTDGGDRKDMREIEGLLKKSGIELSVLMVATKRGAPIPAGDGKVLLNSKKEVVVSRANTALHRPVSDSGGVYAEATISDSDERKIVEHFRRSGSGQVHERVVHQRLQLFYYPLAIALMILPFAFYSFGAKGGIKGFLPLAALLFLSSADLKAGVMDFKYIKEAQEAYRSGDYDRSAELFERVARSSPGSEVWFDLASSYYKSGRYLEALNAFKRVVTKKRELEMEKLYGMGN